MINWGETFAYFHKPLTDFFKRLGSRVPDPGPRRGDFSGMTSSYFGASPSGEKRRERVRALTPDQLRGLAVGDPIIWAIMRARKNQIRQCRWDIIPDVDNVLNVVNIWCTKARDSLNRWDINVEQKVPDLRKDIYGKFDTELQRILKSPYQQSEQRSMIRCLQEQISKYVLDTARGHASEVKPVFECPNAEQSTFTTLVERTVEDLMTWDAAGIAKNNALDGKSLAEMYNIPGYEIYKYINQDETVPKPPDAAYIWMRNGQEIAEWNNEELIYMCENLQYDHYGLSPTEVTAYLIASTIMADKYNRNIVYEDAIPPVLINLGKNFSPEMRNRYAVEFKDRMRQERNPVFFMSQAGDDFSVEKLGMSPKEMQLYEYLKWSVSVKAAVFQIAPQDIGFTMDLHRTTSEVQYRITKDRGLKSMLYTIETMLNREVVKSSYNFDDVQLKFLDVDKMDAQEQSQIDQTDLAGHVININDRRERLGLKAKEGGDRIFHPDPRDPNRLIPLEMLDDVAEDMLELQEKEEEVEVGQATQVGGDDTGAPPAPAGGATPTPKTTPSEEPKPKPSGESKPPKKVEGSPDKLKQVLKSLMDDGEDDQLVKYQLDFPHTGGIDGGDEDEAIAAATGVQSEDPSIIAETLINLATITAYTVGIGVAGALVDKALGRLVMIGSSKARGLAALIRGMWGMRKKTVQRKRQIKRGLRSVGRAIKRQRKITAAKFGHKLINVPAKRTKPKGLWGILSSKGKK